MNQDQILTDPQVSESATEEVLQLKRLLVTLKQKYEQTLQAINQQLQAESSQKQNVQAELDQAIRELQTIKGDHAEERKALNQQQKALKELLHNANKAELPSQNIELRKRVEQMEKSLNDQADLQEKYEQLREDFATYSVQLEEALDGRILAETRLKELQEVFEEKNAQSNTQNKTLETLQLEQESNRNEIDELRKVSEENEANLKMAQQHLAKKMKETALLTDQLNSYQATLFEYQQNEEAVKAHIKKLEESLEERGAEEKKLKEQLQESLKVHESQAAKWEEKYFGMYDKWEASEAKIQELRKLEEKYLQMQAALANLGTFLG